MIYGKSSERQSLRPTLIVRQCFGSVSGGTSGTAPFPSVLPIRWQSPADARTKLLLRTV